MKALTVITMIIALGACKSSHNVLPTNAEQRRYRQQEDREIETPRENDIDKETGLGGGKK